MGNSCDGSDIGKCNVLLWGFGNMNKIILRYAIEKGHRVVGVLGKYNIGENPIDHVDVEKDAQKKLQDKNSFSLKIVDHEKYEDLFTALKKDNITVDVCMLSTKSSIHDCYDTLKILGSKGISTITIAEEAYFSLNTSERLTKELSYIFEKNNALWTGTGAIDPTFGYLPSSLIGSTHKIDKVFMSMQFNVDDYGKALCEAMGVGLTKEDFNKIFGDEQSEKDNKDNKKEDPAHPNMGQSCNEWLAHHHGWKITKTEVKNTPLVINKSIESKTLGKTIQKGDSTGLRAITTSHCSNGMIIENEVLGRVYFDDLEDKVKVEITGEPNSVIELNNPGTVQLTCASAVNRIRQVVASNRKGYVPSCELGNIPYNNNN